MARSTWVLGDAIGVETLQVAELGVDVDDETLPATMWALLAHNIDDEVAGELDESVGAGFCNDQNAREVGVDVCTTWIVI